MHLSMSCWSCPFGSFFIGNLPPLTCSRTPAVPLKSEGQRAEAAMCNNNTSDDHTNTAHCTIQKWKPGCGCFWVNYWKKQEIMSLWLVCECSLPDISDFSSHSLIARVAGKIMFFPTFVPSCFAGNLKGFLNLTMKKRKYCRIFFLLFQLESQLFSCSESHLHGLSLFAWTSRLAFHSKKMETMVSIMISAKKMALLNGMTRRELH